MPNNPLLTGPSFASAKEAETAFYDAFMRADLEAMMDVWATTSDIVCIHPLGAVLYGTDEVREGFRQMFVDAPQMRFKIQHNETIDGDDLVIHILYEYIRMIGDQVDQLPLVVTNSYRQTPTGWRMVLHHASPSQQHAEAAIEPGMSRRVH